MLHMYIHTMHIYLDYSIYYHKDASARPTASRGATRRTMPVVPQQEVRDFKDTVFTFLHIIL